MIQVVSTQHIFGAGGRKVSIFAAWRNETASFMKFSLSGKGESHHLTLSCIFSYEWICFKAAFHVISLVLKSSCGCSFPLCFSRDNFRLLTRRARALWCLVLPCRGSGGCESALWADKLAGVEETRVSGLPSCQRAEWPYSDCTVMSSVARDWMGLWWDCILGAREGRVFLLFHFSLQLLCTRSKLKFNKLLLSVYINCSP